jgi:hypothetical protein
MQDFWGGYGDSSARSSSRETLFPQERSIVSHPFAIVLSISTRSMETIDHKLEGPLIPQGENEPSLREVLALAFCSCIIFLAVVLCFDGYVHKVDNFGDSMAYVNVAEAIGHWNFSGLTVKQFWGLPYLMAAISRITGMSDRSSLLMICFACFFASSVLAYRLWGGWVAAFFTLLNFDWLQRAFLGGSEPLFVALLFGAFLAARRGYWLLAALLASLATTVRPLGFVALLGIGAVLLRHRDYRKLALAVVICVATGFAYAASILHAVGDPLATVHSYTWNAGGPPLFGVPFYAIVKGPTTPAPWTNLVLSLAWIFFTCVGIGCFMLAGRFRPYRRGFPLETFFAVGYLLMICSYNLPAWARGTFARFAIPVVPFAVLGCLPWLPKSRFLTWGLAIVTPVLAACSSIGIINVLHRVILH